MTSKYEIGDQTRWDSYGARLAHELRLEPEKYLISAANLSLQKAALYRKIAAKVRGKRVLEVGIGRGEFSVILAKAGAVVTSIDLGERLVSAAATLAEINEVQCEFVVTDVCELPLADNKFDYVMGNGVLHHLPEHGVRSALAETLRVIKRGGQAYYTEAIEDSRLFDFMQNLIPVGKPGTWAYRPSILQRKKWQEFLADSDDRTMTTREMIESCSGLIVEEIEYYGLLTRASMIWPGLRHSTTLQTIDSYFTAQGSPVRHLGGKILITYRKP